MADQVQLQQRVLIMLTGKNELKTLTSSAGAGGLAVEANHDFEFAGA